MDDHADLDALELEAAVIALERRMGRKATAVDVLFAAKSLGWHKASAREAWLENEFKAAEVRAELWERRALLMGWKDGNGGGRDDLGRDHGR